MIDRHSIADRVTGCHRFSTPADEPAVRPSPEQPKARVIANVPVIQLTRELEQLAIHGAPRTRLCQKIAELIEVVRTS